MDDQTTPDAPGEPCPSWCRSNHREQRHPDDRYHDSLSEYVPALLGRGRGGHIESTQTELLIVTSRKVGHDDTWTFIGEPDRPAQHLQLSPESAARLNDALTRHLSMITSDDA